MKFTERTYNYSFNKKLDVIEITSPAVSMNSRFKSFIESNDISPAKRDLAEAELEDRLSYISEIYDDFADGQDRDKVMRREVQAFSESLIAIECLDDDIAIEAKAAIIEARSEALDVGNESIVIHLNTPMINLSALANEFLSNTNLSSAKVALVERELNVSRDILSRYSDVSVAIDQVESFSEVLTEIQDMSDKDASASLGSIVQK